MHVNELGEGNQRGHSSVCSCKCKSFLWVFWKSDGMSHWQIDLRLKSVQIRKTALPEPASSPGQVKISLFFTMLLTVLGQVFSPHMTSSKKLLLQSQMNSQTEMTSWVQQKITSEERKRCVDQSWGENNDALCTLCSVHLANKLKLKGLPACRVVGSSLKVWFKTWCSWFSAKASKNQSSLSLNPAYFR